MDTLIKAEIIINRSCSYIDMGILEPATNPFFFLLFRPCLIAAYT